MKTLRCFFTDFWSGFDPVATFPFLYERYHIEIDRVNPDYLIYANFGNENLMYKECIRIFFSGENTFPNFNLCDYAIAYSWLTLGDRYFRWKQYMYEYDYDRTPFKYPHTREELLNRKFCNFVYSNNTYADPMRKHIFNALSAYKRVDSGGKFLNNIGQCVSPGLVNKLSFLNQYKFTLAIENSRVDGYATEKIIDPFLAKSLPIYWGNPHIGSDYHPNAMVNLMDYDSIDEAVQEIIRMDQDDDSYLAKLNAPFWLYGDTFDDFRRQEQAKYHSFFFSIFECPLEQAIRRPHYGWAGAWMIPPAPLAIRVKNRLRRMLK